MRFLLPLLALAFACSNSSAPKANDKGEPEFSEGDGTDQELLPPAQNPDIVVEDASFGVPDRPNDGGAGEGRAPIDDGAAPPMEAGPDVSPPAICPNPPTVGDLAIVEFMISSQAGSGDRGEWLEVQSTRSCILNLKGIRIESARGTAAPDFVDISEDFLVPPLGVFVVANSDNPTHNHGLPRADFVWNGAPADVLKNDGDTLRVLYGGQPIESLTYPRFSSMTARSISFPANCAWSRRMDFQSWSLAASEYSPGFRGTPGAPNSDVTCN